MSKLNLVILGGGNGPHCYAGIAASQPDVEVRVLTMFQDEAERWTKALSEGPFEVTFTNWEPGKNKVFSGKPHIVTKDPREAIPDAHLIVFMVPAFAHSCYFKAITPYLEDGAVLCGLPGSSGFLFEIMSEHFGNGVEKYTFMSFESLPWSCRISEYGRSSTIFGAKIKMSGGASGDTGREIAFGKTAIEALEHTIMNRTKLNVKGHLLGDTLMCLNSIIHPCIEYGTWIDWDGRPLDSSDFYHGVDELSARMITETNNEVLMIRNAIQNLRPDINLSQIENIHDWYTNSYPDCDKPNLYTIFRSFPGYKGIKHPMVTTEDGKYFPDFKHRYFTEDIPYGLVVLRGIAEIVGVATPHMDKIIYWAQQHMGKEYLVDDKLEGKDINESRCPQKYGITTLDQFLELL